MKFPKRIITTGITAALVTAAALAAQTLDQAAAASKTDLEKALQELAALRNDIKDQRIPLSREINSLEDQVIAKRREAERLLRLRDSRTIDLSSLKSEVKAREDEVAYLSCRNTRARSTPASMSPSARFTAMRSATHSSRRTTRTSPAPTSSSSSSRS